jgi:hypothetical protein
MALLHDPDNYAADDAERASHGILMRSYGDVSAEYSLRDCSQLYGGGMTANIMDWAVL